MSYDRLAFLVPFVSASCILGCLDVQDHGGLTDTGRDAGSDVRTELVDANTGPNDAFASDVFANDAFARDAATSPAPVTITVNTQAILEEGWQYVGITPWAAETVPGTVVPLLREGDCMRRDGSLPSGYVEGRFADTELSWWSATLDGVALPLMSTAASVTTGPRFFAMMDTSATGRTLEVTFAQPGHPPAVFELEMPPAAMNVRMPTVTSGHPPSCTSCAGSGSPSVDVAVPTEYTLTTRAMLRGSSDSISCESTDGMVTIPAALLGATPTWAGIQRFGLQLNRTRRETVGGITWEGIQSISLGAPVAIRVP